MIEKLTDIGNQVGSDVISYSNDEIVSVNDLDKIVIFDDFVCEKNQKPLIDYFIRGRHKNRSVIYLSQSLYVEKPMKIVKGIFMEIYNVLI